MVSPLGLKSRLLPLSCAIVSLAAPLPSHALAAAVRARLVSGTTDARRGASTMFVMSSLSSSSRLRCTFLSTVESVGGTRGAGLAAFNCRTDEDGSAFANRGALNTARRSPRGTRGMPRRGYSPTSLQGGRNGNEGEESSFLSTSKASVSFRSGGSDWGSVPANVSPVDRILLTLTSDRTSLALGSLGVLLLLANRLVSFPDDAAYEASRSRIDLLGVFAAGSVLLNGITKLDVTSVAAERVALEGKTVDGGGVTWTTGVDSNDSQAPAGVRGERFRSTAEWALTSLLRCSPARTAVLLATTAPSGQGTKWTPLAMCGVVPSDPSMRASIPADRRTPILDRMARAQDDGSASYRGGTVGGGADVAAVAGGGVGGRPSGPRESYLPTLQALPGRVEFTYLPPNAQEALLLPAGKSAAAVDGGRDGECPVTYYAVVLGGDTAKSFAPRDVAWCRRIASWIGESVGA